MITVLIAFITFLSTFFAIYHLLSSFRYRKAPARPARRQLGFSVIIPCYNEAGILPSTVAGLLKLRCGALEVIFVNDGSADGTLRVLNDLLELSDCREDDRPRPPGVRRVLQSARHPNLFVLDKPNTGKADSLNKGILFSRRPLIVTLDGDCVLAEDALTVMNRVFQDDAVIAAGGAVRVMQFFRLDRRATPVIALQTLDFMKGFQIYKASLAYNNALNIISGAFGVFRKDALQAVGGFRSGLGEDIDITIRLQEYALRSGKKVVYDTGAVCYTECPETWRDLARQRVRWQKAFWDALIQNRRFLLRSFRSANVCFFLLLDAAFSGSMAVISFLCNFLLFALRAVYGFPPLFLFLALLAVLFQIFSACVAIRRSGLSERGRLGSSACARANTAVLFLSIFTDLLCFSALRIYYFIRGTVSYALNHRGWDKLMRTSNSYVV